MGGRATENRPRRRLSENPRYSSTRLGAISGTTTGPATAGSGLRPRECSQEGSAARITGRGDGFYGGGVPGASNYDDSYGYGGFQSQSQSQAFGGSQGGHKQSQGGHSQSSRATGPSVATAVAGFGHGYSQSQARRTSTTRWGFAWCSCSLAAAPRVSGGGPALRCAAVSRGAPVLAGAREIRRPAWVVARDND